MKKIIILIPYFGKWPEWIDLFLETCKHNPTIDWLFFTDCGEPQNKCPNVRYIHMTFAELNRLISSKLGMGVNIINPYKLCDFKSAYGVIFDEHIRGYDYYGYGDIDVIYGDIRKFATDDVLQHDFISFHGDRVSGHLALFKNCEAAKRKYLEVSDWKERLLNPEYTNLDEKAIFKVIDSGSNYFVEKWSTPHKKKQWRDGTYFFPKEWYWRDGKVTNDNDDIEYLYFHFMEWRGGRWGSKEGWSNWRPSKKIVHFDHKDAPYGFKVTRYGFFRLGKDISAEKSFAKKLFRAWLWLDYQFASVRIEKWRIVKKGETITPARLCKSAIRRIIGFFAKPDRQEGRNG